MIRTDRRRFPILFAAIAALALAMALLFSPVQAQEGSAPDKPTGLSATASHDQVVLTWDDPGDASITGYVILRRVRVNNTGGEFSELVADTGTAATTYTDATVKANTTYTYRIKATNEHGVSERSRWFHIDVPAAPEPEEEQAAERPDKPRGLDATATHDQVVLTWDDPGDASITGYVILRRVRVNNTGGEFSELVADTGTAATTYTDDTVAAETRYTYRIKAINEHGVSERSRWFHIDVPAAPEPEEEQAAEPPDQPTGLDATASHDQVVLTWDDPGDASITGYVILRRVRVNNTGGEFSELVADTGTAATTYTDDSVQANTTYTYRIKATNEHGVSERSRWFHIDTPDAPEAVEGDDHDGEDGGGAPGHATPPGPGGRANVSEGDTDLPVDTSTTGEVDVGGSVTGTIGTGGDGDWFKVELEAGKRYQIDMEGKDTGRGDLGSPLIQLLYDADGNSIPGTRDTNSGVGFNARLIYTPGASAAYFVWVAADDGQEPDTGTYTLSVIVLGANGASEADTDFSGTNISTVDVGASVTGTISTPTDTDWFDVALEVGKIYQFDLEGSHNGRGTLEDPYLKLYRFATVLEVNGDINSTNKNSQIVYTPTTTGTHSLEATTIGTATGTYTLSVRDISPCTLNTGDIWCGVVTVGELKTSADVLVSHGFADTSSLSAGGLVGNPGDTMFSVGDNDYTIRGLYVGAPGGNNDGSLFLLLTADLSDDDKENLVFKIDGVTTDRALSDAGSLSTGLYSWANTGLDWSSTTTVTVRLQGPPTSDDFPADATTTGQVDVGGSATGNIESVGDADWFLVELEAGTRYQFDVEGAPTVRGTVSDPTINAVRDAGGNTITGTQNDDSGVGNNARTIFTATASGAHYVVAAAYQSTGTYTLSVIVLGANGASEAHADFPDTTSTSGRVDVGASVTGNIASAGDIDLFAVRLVVGRTYQFDLEGSHNGRGTLEDPYLTLSDGSLAFIAENGDINATNLNSQFIYTATAAGTYYLEAVELSGNSTGTYTLSVRDITPPPDDSADPPADSTNVSEPDGEDLPEGITTTGRVEVGGSVTGEIAPALDVDWFAVELKKGKRYQFDVEGADTGRGNLADPHLWGLQDAGGQAVSGARSNDGGVGKNGRVINTPDAEGTYYIAVAGADSTTGTYTLSVIVLGANGASEADTDFPRDTTTTGRVEVGASATGNIDPGEDLDGFRVDLEAGKRYRFDLEGADTGRGSQADPILALYGDSFNVSHYIDEDDDGGEGLNSRLTYTATATGIYHLEVAGLDPGTYTLSVREILLAVAVPPGGLGPSEIPGAVRNVSVSYSPVSGIGGQIVWWDAPDETGTGAQWITEFRIYGSASEGCGGYLLDEYEVEHPGSTTPPEINGVPTGFKYFKIVYVGPVKFGVAAVNELGEGPCVEGPEPPPPPDSP